MNHTPPVRPRPTSTPPSVIEFSQTFGFVLDFAQGRGGAFGVNELNEGTASKDLSFSFGKAKHEMKSLCHRPGRVGHHEL